MQVSNRTLFLKVMILIVLFTLLAACSPASPATPQQGSESEHALEHDGDEEHSMEHDEEEHALEHAHEDRIPNEGAVIRIVSPEDGTAIKEGEDFVIEIEAENFTLGEDGSHWHYLR